VELSQVGLILLFATGIALIIIEAFIPGVVIGIIGFCMAIASIVFAFQAGMDTLGWSLVVAGVLSIPVIIIIAIKTLKHFFSVNETQEDFSAAQLHLKDMVGQEGVAITQLRPAGTVRFGDKKVDVVSESELIERDTRVKIIEVESNRVVVRAVTE